MLPFARFNEELLDALAGHSAEEWSASSLVSARF